MRFIVKVSEVRVYETSYSVEASSVEEARACVLYDEVEFGEEFIETTDRTVLEVRVADDPTTEATA